MSTPHLKCDCGQLNDSDQMICSHCGTSLLFAEEVWDENPDQLNDPVAPSANAAGIPLPPRGTDSKTMLDIEPAPCFCKDGGLEDPANPNAVCERCGGRISRDSATPTTAIPPNGTVNNSSAAFCPSVVVGEQTFHIGDGLVLGRDPIITPPEICRYLSGRYGVSRRHLWIGSVENSLLLLDLGSRNGTWFGTSRLQPWKLSVVDMDSPHISLFLGGQTQITVERKS